MAGDIDRVRAENSLSDLALKFGVALQRDGDEWEGLCPFHQEDTPSFTIFPGKDGIERFHCFGCAERGDVLDFTQKIKGVDLREAIKILGGEVFRDNIKPRAAVEARDIYAGIVPLDPTGEILPGKRVKVWNPKREKSGTFTPSMIFPYRRADGSLFGYVLRNDFTDQNTGKAKKETPMVMWVRLPDGSECWSRYPFPKPRPLYGLDGLTDGQVVVVEGEKCRDAMKRATGRNVVSWAGGTYGVEHCDWSPLFGRSVVIWPDADAPGRATALKIAAMLVKHGCTVKIIDVPDEYPDGWDVADAVDGGLGKAEIDSFMRVHVRPFELPPDPDPPSRQPEPEPENLPHDFVPEQYADVDMGQWELVHDVLDQEPQMEVIERNEPIIALTGQRREVPASGRKLPTQHIVQWGGDIGELREWAFLTGRSVFCNVHTGEMMGKIAFDMTMTMVTPIAEIENGKGETKNVKPPPSKSLIEFNDGIVASDAMYRPDVDAMMVWRDGIRYLNAYLPATVPDADPNWRQHGSWQKVYDHIHNVVPDGADLIIQWLAHNVQFPGKKIQWAPVLVGCQGDGKTTIGKVVQSAMGARNVQPVSPEALFSDYTSWATGAALRVLEEIRVQGQNRSQVMDKLKPFITNDAIDVVGKGKDGTTVANVTNYLALTNHEDALAIDEGDRRWGVWKTRFKDRAQVVRELSSAYWRALHEAIDCHPEVIRGWLMSVDLSTFDRFQSPEMTTAKRTMINASMSPMEGVIREAIEIGGAGIGRDVLSTDCLNDAIKGIDGRQINTTILAGKLRGMGWAKLVPTLKWNGKTRRAYYIPGDWSEGLSVDALKEEIRSRLVATEVDRGDEPPSNSDQQEIVDW